MLKSTKFLEKSKNNSFGNYTSFDDIQNTSNFQFKMDIFTHYSDKELNQIKIILYYVFLLICLDIKVV